MLLNGGESNGWAGKSFVYPHRVKDLLDNLRRRIKKEKTDLVPGWEGYKGRVNRHEKKGYLYTRGQCEMRNEHEVIINEVPPSKPIKEYKAQLEE